MDDSLSGTFCSYFLYFNISYFIMDNYCLSWLDLYILSVP